MAIGSLIPICGEQFFVFKIHIFMHYLGFAQERSTHMLGGNSWIPSNNIKHPSGKKDAVSVYQGLFTSYLRCYSLAPGMFGGHFHFKQPLENHCVRRR